MKTCEGCIYFKLDRFDPQTGHEPNNTGLGQCFVSPPEADRRAGTAPGTLKDRMACRFYDDGAINTVQQSTGTRAMQVE